MSPAPPSSELRHIGCSPKVALNGLEQPVAAHIFSMAASLTGFESELSL